MKLPTFVLQRVAKDLDPARGPLESVEMLHGAPAEQPCAGSFSQRVVVVVNAVELTFWIRVQRKIPASAPRCIDCGSRVVGDSHVCRRDLA